jgi:hypothetical protein
MELILRLLPNGVFYHLGGEVSTEITRLVIQSRLWGVMEA